MEDAIYDDGAVLTELDGLQFCVCSYLSCFLPRRTFHTPESACRKTLNHLVSFLLASPSKPFSKSSPNGLSKEA